MVGHLLQWLMRGISEYFRSPEASGKLTLTKRARAENRAALSDQEPATSD
jgi:hypothetical protein